MKDDDQEGFALIVFCLVFLRGYGFRCWCVGLYVAKSFI